MKAIVVLAVFLSWAGSLQALELEGVELPENLSLDGQELVLNGAGVRKRFIFELYLGSLYLDEKSQDAASIIKRDAPMAIRLDIVSDKVNNKNMTEATRRGFDKAMDGDTQPLEAEINQFLSAFEAEIVKGDSFKLLYLPDVGVKIYKNGQLQTTVPGLAFKRALFGVWLGDDPAQKRLKRGMLGG